MMTDATDSLLTDLLADETALRDLLAFRNNLHNSAALAQAELRRKHDHLAEWSDRLAPGGSRELFYYLREFAGREDQARSQAISHDVWMNGSPGRVLDVGCGIGQTVLALARRWPAQYVAMDPNPIACALARVATRASERVEVVTGSAEHLPFADKSFDRIHSRVVIQYTNSYRALAEMVRCLKPGGRLYLKVADWRYYSRRLWPVLAHLDGRGLFLNSFPLANGIICQWFGQPAGFKWKGARFQEHFLGRGYLRSCERRLSLGLLYEDWSARLPTPSYVWEKLP